jgi:RNA polymerase sigma-70 factor, ECF subfamily
MTADAHEKFCALYEKFADPVYWFCRRRLGTDAGLAEDVVGDVFTVVWRRIDTVPVPPDDRVFVFAVAYRQLRNHQRSLWRRARLQRRLDAEARRPVADPATEQAAGEWVRRAVLGLPASEREALFLVVVEGFSQQEAGRLLDCSPNAVALRLHRARSRLRVDLVGEAKNEPSNRGCEYTSQGGR